MNTQTQFTFHGAPIRDAKLLPFQPPGQVIGRNNELKSMHLSLKAGSTVLLYGEMGMGKSALASVLATAHIASNPGGVLWFNITEDNFDHLVARVGRAYGINSPDNKDAIRAVLTKNRPMIVLDGLIDLDAARKFVGEYCQGISTIITNEVGSNGAWLPVELRPLTPTDSTSLLRYYTGLQDESYLPDLEGVSKFLGGVPLAIELAGRHIAGDNLTPGELLTRLPSSTGQDTTAMMMSVIFKRLPAATQGLLLVLSATFTGTASAELLSDLSNAPVPTLIPLMRQLAARGVVREFLSYGQFAYRVHPAIQDYARIWLESYRRLQATEGRALESITNYADRHARGNPADQDRLAAEIDNIVGAAAYATETGQGDALLRLTRAISEGAGNFVALRGLQPEQAQIKKLGLLLTAAPTEATQPVGATRPSGDSLPDAMAEPPTEAQDTPAVAHPPVSTAPKPPNLPGFLEPEVTEPMFAEPPLSSSLDETQLASAVSADMLPRSPESTMPESIMEEVPEGVPEPEAWPVTQVEPEPPPVETFPEPQPESFAPPPDMPEVQPAPEPAAAEPDALPASEGVDQLASPLAELEQKIADAQTSGDFAAQASLLQSLGKAYADLGNHTQAMTHYKQALEAYEMLEAPHGMLSTLEALVGLDARIDDQTIYDANRAIDLAKKQGSPTQIGRLQNILADMQIMRGEFPAAIDNYRGAVESLRNSEDWLTLGTIMNKLGSAYLAENKLSDGVMILEQALQIFDRLDRPQDKRATLAALAGATRQMMQLDKSRDYYHELVSSARADQDHETEGVQLAELAYVYGMNGDLDRTVQHYWMALHKAFEINDTALQARTSLQLGRLLIDDTRTLGLAADLLKESNALTPSSEAQRLLNRATKRLDRTSAAGVSIPAAESAIKDYAARVYADSVPVAEVPPQA